MKNKSTKYVDNEMSIAPDRTFFCSELIAKAYKCLGIINNDDVSSASFYPKHFSDRGNGSLKFLGEMKLEPEQIILLKGENVGITNGCKDRIHTAETIHQDSFA